MRWQPPTDTFAKFDHATTTDGVSRGAVVHPVHRSVPHGQVGDCGGKRPSARRSDYRPCAQ